MTSVGFFISFEGVEGAGKSTQVRLLADALKARGREVLETREPGGTPLGEELRGLVKHFAGPGGVAPEAELLLMCACRAQLMRDVILPFLARGGVVVCDRFADSTTVYQGFGRRLDLATIDRLHELVTHGRWPDLTILLDLEVRAGLERAAGRNPNPDRTDRFETESAAFHETIRRGFLRLAAAHPARFRIVAADLPAAEVSRRVLAEVLHALG